MTFSSFFFELFIKIIDHGFYIKFDEEICVINSDINSFINLMKKVNNKMNKLWYIQCC